jgi:hypothetical protein
MKSMFFTLMASFMLSLSANAALLKLEPGQNNNNGVNISKSGAATLNGNTYELTTVGSGLRSKKVLLANVKVYVAQLLVSSPERFSRTNADALKSLEDSQTVAIQLTFLRSVDADKVQVSFRDAFDANKIDINTQAMKQFLSAVQNGGDALDGKTLTIATTKNSDGSEVLVYEDSNGKQTTIKGNKGLTHDIFAIWLGTPADDGVANLKKSLLQGN